MDLNPTESETSDAANGRVRLSPVETRVLGGLLEKEKLTPDNYPMSLNGLVAACNQTTARDPVLTLGEREVQDALDTLRQKKLATVVFGAGARVQKYRHNLLDIYNLDEREVALMCVLILRGPQTVGELRGRSERMAVFAGLPEAEACLENLANGDQPLVRLLPARPGQKERRYVQLLSGEPVIEEAAVSFPSLRVAPVVPAVESVPSPSRVEALEEEVRGLCAQMEALREEFERFKRQFE